MSVEGSAVERLARREAVTIWHVPEDHRIEGCEWAVQRSEGRQSTFYGDTLESACSKALDRLKEGE